MDEQKNLRRCLVARIMCRCGELGLDRETRHQAQYIAVGKRDMRQCSVEELRKILEHLDRSGHARHDETHSSGFDKNEWRFVFKADVLRQPLLKKLYRIAEAWGKSKAYIEGIAQHMRGGVNNPLQLCSPERLREIVAACEIQRKRERGRGTQVEPQNVD